MPLRPESSVSVGFDEFGSLVFDGDRPGPVIHRTPEELGVPAVIKDEPRKPSWFKPESDLGPGSMQRDNEARKVHRAFPGTMKHNRDCAKRSVRRLNVLQSDAARGHEMQPRVIGGESVVMPAAATVGAEPLEGFIAERRKEEETVMPRNNGRIPDEIRLKILAEPATESNVAVGRKYGVKDGTVWYLRKQAGIHSVAKPGSRKGAVVRAMVPAKRNAQAARPVEIDPHAPGTASAMISALARVDARFTPVKIEIEFSHEEVAKVLEGLHPVQRAAFLSAGLRAALLA